MQQAPGKGQVLYIVEVKEQATTAHLRGEFMNTLIEDNRCARIRSGRAASAVRTASTAAELFSDRAIACS